VELRGASYNGLVRVSATRHAAGDAEEWIADRLSDLAPRLGLSVLRGRLYSPLQLDG
jgi:hypothetical protein